MRRHSGMSLLILLVFIPVLVLAGLYALEDSIMEAKMTRAAWQAYHVQHRVKVS